MNDGKILFIYVAQDLSGVRKFVLVNWCGEGVTGMKKGLFSNHTQDAARLFKGVHVTINARNENDINQDDISRRLKTATGASFHRQHEGQNTESTPRTSGITYEKRDYDQTTESRPSQSTIAYEKRDYDQSTENKPSASAIKYEAAKSDQSTESKPKPSALPGGSSSRPTPGSAPAPAPIKKPGFPPSSAPAPAPAPARSAPPPAAAPPKPVAIPPPAKAAPPPPKAAPPPPEPEPEPVQEEQQWEEPVQEEVQQEQTYEEPVQEEQQYEQQQEGGRTVTALYDYEGENEGDLRFKEGGKKKLHKTKNKLKWFLPNWFLFISLDVITVIDDTDPSGWYTGSLADGTQGTFPSNFVQ